MEYDYIVEGFIYRPQPPSELGIVSRFVGWVSELGEIIWVEPPNCVC